MVKTILCHRRRLPWWGLAAMVGLMVSLAQVSLGQSQPSATEPRIGWIDQQMEGDYLAALESVEQHQLEDPAAAKVLGLDYLRGHLLLLLERRQEAMQSFAQAMASTPQLEPYSRYRLASQQEELGHPEVAAGLVAGLLSGKTPSPLVNNAMRLLERTVDAGGDCRLLKNFERKPWSGSNRRRLSRLQAVCAQRGRDAPRATQIYLQLLEDKRDDDVALGAAHSLTDLLDDPLTPRQHYLLGLTFYSHRLFDLAVPHLARVLVHLAKRDLFSRTEAFECRYALSRSNFWLGRYALAADAFGDLAATTSQPRLRAQCFYQQGRSLELNDQWTEALVSFEKTLQAEPNGRWADTALIAGLRLLWLRGEEATALEKLAQLQAQRHPTTTSRALIFIASTDLVEGREDRAGAWLDLARRLGRISNQEIAYWQGRLAVLQGDPDQAVRRYREALITNAYHPYGVAAKQRLADPQLQASVRKLSRIWQRSGDPEDLLAAYLVAPPQSAEAQNLFRRLNNLHLSDSGTAPFLTMERSPTPQWPLWKSSLSRPEELLMALGIFDEASSSVLRHFPVSNPSLALTGSQMLANSGATHRSLYVAEVLAKRVPKRLPTQVLSHDYRRLLFPFRYSYLILRETKNRDVDPYLLAGLIREESRFDHRAFSAAAARGLTQFVLPTALRISRDHNLGPLVPSDLDKPEVSIRLGAAYLYQLSQEFDGSLPQVIAAYNAGEPQAALWRRYCRSDELEEYLAKVAFRETRNYLGKVLTSRHHYFELYGPSGAASGSDDRR